MKVKSESEVAQSSRTLSDHMDCSLPVSSVHGIFQTRVLEWGAIAFSAIPPRQCLNSLYVPDITALGALWAKRQVGPESRIIGHREGNW